MQKGRGGHRTTRGFYIDQRRRCKIMQLLINKRRVHRLFHGEARYKISLWKRHLSHYHTIIRFLVCDITKHFLEPSNRKQLLLTTLDIMLNPSTSSLTVTHSWVYFDLAMAATTQTVATDALTASALWAEVPPGTNSA
jgi:hypothetical protein